jgi:hypothetical protein
MILEKPRERHYLLGHEGFRHMVESDPHQFFERMSTKQDSENFVAALINQVEKMASEDDTILDPKQVKVLTSSIENKPLLLIVMPDAKAYVECVYVGILCHLDIKQPDLNDKPKIDYFTLELGQADDGAECRMFCEWKGETHYNLAEMDAGTTLEQFGLVIAQRLESKN